MILMWSPTMMLAFMSLIISTLMALTSANWIILWSAMELNLISFIPIMMQTNNNQETEGSVKYFLAQALGSALLLISGMAMWMPLNMYPNSIIMLLIVAMMLKLGSVPCHFWYPSVMSSISWMSCLVLSTWQKLAPLSMLCFIMKQSNMTLITLVACLNALVGGFMGMNQNQLRPIMAYSSIGHIGWMLSLTTLLKPYASIAYFLIYSLLITPLFLCLKHFNLNSIKQLNSLSPKTMYVTMAVIVLILSLSGLPPLTGFIPKFMTILLLVESMKMVVLVLILGSLMNLFFYLNITINMMMSINNYSLKLMMNSKVFPNLMLISSMLMLGLSPLFMLYAMTVLY